MDQHHKLFGFIEEHKRGPAQSEYKTLKLDPMKTEPICVETISRDVPFEIERSFLSRFMSCFCASLTFF